MLTGAELRELARDRSPRLRTMINKICAAQEEVHVTDLDSMITALSYSGDEHDVRWIKSLKALMNDGSIESLRNGDETWGQHRAYVRSLVAQKKIPFDINDSVISNDKSGRRGVIVDYVPTENMYIVLFNPFQVGQFKADQLIKVASDKAS